MLWMHLKVKCIDEESLDEYCLSLVERRLLLALGGEVPGRSEPMRVLRELDRENRHSARERRHSGGERSLSAGEQRHSDLGPRHDSRERSDREHVQVTLLPSGVTRLASRATLLASRMTRISSGVTILSSGVTRITSRMTARGFFDSRCTTAGGRIGPRLPVLLLSTTPPAGGRGCLPPVLPSWLQPCFFRYFSGSLSNFSRSSFEQK